MEYKLRKSWCLHDLEKEISKYTKEGFRLNGPINCCFANSKPFYVATLVKGR